MPDLDTLFADFRTEARAEIVPPGAGQARQTVVRRRVVGRAVTAVAVLALAAAGSLTALSLRDGGPTAPPAGPALDASQRETLAENAMGVLGFSVVGVEPRPGVVYGPVESGERSYQLGSSDRPFPAGTYELRAACAGEGAISVEVHYREGSALVEAVCQAGVESLEFVVPQRSAGSLTLTVTPDDRAKERAGFAMALTDPREVTVLTMDGERPEGAGLEFVTPQTSAQHSSSVAANRTGTLRLVLYCAGAGSLSATLDADGTANTTEFTCPWTGAAGSVTVATRHPTGTSTVTLAMTGGSAYVYFAVELIP
jgi:hypothetical protein